MGAASRFLTDMFKTRSSASVCIVSYANEREQAKRFPPVELYTRDPGSIERFLKKYDKPGRAVYFGVNTVIDGKTRSKENVAEITSLFADLDFKGIVESRSEIEAVLARLPLVASRVVFSGNGLHPYWWIQAPVELGERVEAALKRLAWALAGDPAVCEIARVMRLPGSHNSKEDAWKPVNVIAKNDVTYELEQLETWLAGISEPLLHRKGKSNGGTPPSNDPFAGVHHEQTFAEPIDVEQVLDEMQYHGSEGNGVNLTQYRVIGSLLHEGCEVDDVISYVVAQTWARIPESATWDQRSEIRQLRDMCRRTFMNHPELLPLQNSKPDWLHLPAEKLITPTLKKNAPPVLNVYYLEDLRARKRVNLEWDVEDFILSRQLNSIIGEGAVGKDLLLFQLAIAATCGGKILERDVRQCRVMYFNVEDDDNELRRREENIRNFYSKTNPPSYRPREKELMIVPMFGKDTLFAAFDSKTGVVVPRPLYEVVRKQIAEFKPGMVIVGNRVNIFGVNQNEDSQARQCLALLNAICIDFGTTVVMPSHPSMRGSTTGEGTSGSVQWSNGVRLRSYLSRVIDKDDDGKEIEEDPTRRLLEVKKSNYSARGMNVTLYWKDGVFQPDPVTINYPTSDINARQAEEDSKAENEFLRLLDAHIERKINVNADDTARNNAPTVFARDPSSSYKGKKGRAALVAAMHRLYERKMIRSVEYGPPSKPRTRIERIGLRVVK